MADVVCGRSYLVPRFRLGLILVSGLAAAAWQLLTPVAFTHDSTTYLQAARRMFGLAGGRFLYFRTEGYPLFLGLTGVFALDSFSLLWIVQGAMAWMIPMICYSTVRLVDERAARLASLLILLSGVPFIFAKAVMTQQVYLFLQALAIHLAMRGACNIRAWHVYALTACGVLLYLLRPSGEFQVLLMLLVIAGYRAIHKHEVRSTVLHVGLAVAVLVAVKPAVGTYHQMVVEDFAPEWRLSSASPHEGGTAMTGRLLFYAAYIYGAHHSTPNLVKAENGPASAELQARLEEFFRAYPDRTEHLLGGDAMAASRETGWFYAKATGARFFAAWVAMDSALGTAQADGLFRRTAIEAFRLHPEVFIWFVEKLAVAMLGPQLKDNNGRASFEHHSPFVEQRPDSPALTPRLRREIEAQSFTPAVQLAFQVWGWYFLAFKALTSLAVLVTLPRVLSGPGRVLVILTACIWLTELAALSVFAFPLTHYVAFCINPFLISASLWFARSRVG